MKLARITAATILDGMRFGNVIGTVKVPTPQGVKTKAIIDPVLGEWALFYWRLRFRLEPLVLNNGPGTTPTTTLVLKERFSFTDRAKALNE
jgi:hypothetical protein